MKRGREVKAKGDIVKGRSLNHHDVLYETPHSGPVSDRPKTSGQRSTINENTGDGVATQ